MSGSLNKIMIIGNLGKEPDVRFMPDGSKVASFSVATNERWDDKTTGERKERTEWHRVSVFNAHLIDIIERYIRKGTKVYVEGQIQTRKWTDKTTGTERQTTEIVLGKTRGALLILDPKTNNDTGDRDDSMPSDMVIDDEVPFG
ncbi:MAG: single-stranded DNA-binding protein [Holosporales bacterium]|jgi:single-strand DNA-binding protein|nr:single-stranded DNA-binding protein [Holosporales bacterium]